MKKVPGGPANQWVGYGLDMQSYEVGISEGRRRWIIQWIDDLLAGKRVDRL